VAQYLVLKVSGPDIPALDGDGSAHVYRSADVATEQLAVNAAIAKFGVQRGERLWAVPVSSLVRYATTVTSAPG
jgi:hypothetical protein